MSGYLILAGGSSHSSHPWRLITQGQAGISALGDAAEGQRGQFSDRRISICEVAVAGDHDSPWKGRVVHTVADEPAVVLGIDDLAGWLRHPRVRSAG